MLMTPEEKERYDRIDRQLEFLAAHQVQLSSDLGDLRSIVAMQSQQIAKHDEQIARLGEVIGMQGGQVQSVAETLLRIAQVVDERDRQTDAKINALIGVVERYFSNGKK